MYTFQWYIVSLYNTEMLSDAQRHCKDGKFECDYVFCKVSRILRHWSGIIRSTNPLGVTIEFEFSFVGVECDRW